MNINIPKDKKDKLSPMMGQYLEIKEQHQDEILMFRLGDFYEMFFDDAIIASKELELVLTGRDCGLAERAPMCGVPFHSCDNYIARLIQKGYKVAICEQMENPSDAKKIVKRDIVRVITPGTVIEDSMLDEKFNNYLCTVCLEKETVGICFVDASTGEMNATEIKGEKLSAAICNQLGRFYPTEILLNSQAGQLEEVKNFIEQRLDVRYEIRPDIEFDGDNCKERIMSHFEKRLYQLDLEEGTPIMCAVGSALNYLYNTQRTGLAGINKINIYFDEQYMGLDLAARRNLELTKTIRSGETRGTLFWVLDKTMTSMGKRLLRSFIEQPLINPAKIISRQNGVEELVNNSILRGELMNTLKGIFDMQRLMSRVLYGSANPREILSFGDTLEKLPEIKKMLACADSNILKEIYSQIDELGDIYELIKKSISENAPVAVKDGGVIKDGYSQEIDLLRSDKKDGTGFITRIEEQERERTGIKTLKIKYNKVFGYCIEVTNSFKDQVPEHYIRKQTLTNCERYITEELKQLETRVLGAQERLSALELELFNRIKSQIAGEIIRIQTTAEAVAKLDVLCSLAQTAQENNYVRPEININGKIDIKNGRHPVVEALIKAPFVPNDTYLDNKDDRCAIITGPNMAGKSTYMRQVALIVLMSQMGSFVPADSADISICDAIFTRVGASDDLASGNSTFMVEMSEVADILKNATSKSLIVFDEIGRGTSTFDGMAIARAVLEYVSDKSKIGAKTLFATHYHELTELEDMIQGVKNYNTTVKKRGDDITFLRRIVSGPADGSYGIEVAKLAGIPNSVVKEARRILQLLESKQEVTTPKMLSKDEDEEDLNFSFDDSQSKEIVERLKNIDVNTLTPIESMQYLYDLVERAKNL